MDTRRKEPIGQTPDARLKKAYEGTDAPMPQLQFADDPLEDEPGFGGPAVSVYLEMLSRRRWLIVGCVLGALLLAGVVTWYSKPMYRATALLNFERDRANPFEVGGAPNRDSGADSE